MDSSQSSNRFIGLFSQPEEPPDRAAIAASAGVHDLEEEEIFSTEFHSTEPNQRSPNPPSSWSTPNPNPSHRPSLSRFSPSRFHERNVGILAALPEEENKQSLLHRNLSSYSSSSSSARLIPVISKTNLDYVLSLKGGKIYHQSAPMNVPLMPLRRASRESAMLDRDVMGNADVDEEEMLPPHEIVAKAASKESPMTTFSMLEGFGRTLKGRDLRRVRNAVWRQTGFQD